MPARTLLLCLVFTTLGAVGAIFATGSATASQSQTLPDDGLAPDERVNIKVYETVNRGVVNITTKSLRVDNFFFMESPSEGSGSGSVIDRKGHILTNFHVIDGQRVDQKNSLARTVLLTSNIVKFGFSPKSVGVVASVSVASCVVGNVYRTDV